MGCDGIGSDQIRSDYVHMYIYIYICPCVCIVLNLCIYFIHLHMFNDISEGIVQLLHSSNS